MLKRIVLTLREAAARQTSWLTILEYWRVDTGEKIQSRGFQGFFWAVGVRYLHAL
jgi:hypothetical protein